MGELKFTQENCQIVTDDSCCLGSEELSRLGVEAIPFMATINQLETPVRTLLKRKEFILFVGTAPSLSIINDTISDVAELLDEKDKSLNAKDRILIFNTSCFSGGLGMFVTLFVNFINKKPRIHDELLAYTQFLANHIAHFFVEPKEKRWNNLIYVPRTGPVNYDGGKFRGNHGVYNHLAATFRDYAYHADEKVWICHGEVAESFHHARNLARQFKRCCPDSHLDLSHRIMPHTVANLTDDAVACFFLSTDVRPDEPGPYYSELQYQEIEEKNNIAKENITAITRFAQAFRKNPCLSSEN
ncbi:hypothetical protein IJ768_00740 [Candidatus Saccharibacteria bacterium]|nr:hypothetical protein [Candidatus Saccharibacteria bacterium]